MKPIFSLALLWPLLASGCGQQQAPPVTAPPTVANERQAIEDNQTLSPEAKKRLLDQLDEKKAP